VHVPARLLDGWGDVLAADVSLGKRLFVHNPNSLSNRPGRSIPALLIVLDWRKCTLFGVDWGWRGGQILAAKVPRLADHELAGVDFACRDPEGPMLGQFE